jgi:hypothetical protein
MPTETRADGFLLSDDRGEVRPGRWMESDLRDQPVS